MNQNSKDYQLELTFDAVDKAVFDLFSTIKVSDKDFKEVVAVVGDKIDVMNQDNKEKYNKTLLQLNRIKFLKKEFIKNNL